MDYTFDKNLKFNNQDINDAKNRLINAIELNKQSKFPIEYNGIVLCEITEVDARMCEKELNKQFSDVLFSLLLEISDNLDEAIKSVFAIYNEPFDEKYIQRMLYLAVIDIECHSMNGNKIESYKQALIDFLA